MINSTNAAWKSMLQHKMKKVGGLDLFLRSNYTTKIINDLEVPTFYKELFNVFLVDLRQKKSLCGPMKLWNNGDY